MKWRKALASFCLSAILLQSITISAKEPTVYKPLDSFQFSPLLLETPPPIIEPPRIILRTHPPIKQVEPKPKAMVKSLPKVAGAHSVLGKASWYCSPAKPICHHSYPPGSMVAAACGKLRRAMGGEADKFWRGKTVKVETSKTNFIYVKLVDWCGSKDKTIDLYWAPMSKLGGTGILDVKISW